MSFVETSTCTKPDEILDEPDEVFSLLKEWGLQVLHDLFKEHEIDISTLKYLSDSEIKELIPKIGHRSLFCVRLEQWRRSQNQPMRLETRTKTASKRLHSNDSISSEVDGPPPSSIVKIEETEFMESSFCDNVPNIKCNESHVLDNNLTFANINEFSVFEWLSHDADGQCILDSYNVLNCLSNEQRKNVLKTIARWMVDQKLPKTVAVFEQIRVQLLELFPTEHFTSNDLLRWFTLIENGNDPDSSIEIIDDSSEGTSTIRGDTAVNADNYNLDMDFLEQISENIEKNDLQNLLAEWKLECVYNKCQVEDISIEDFKYMTSRHCELLLSKDFKLNILIKFERALKQWQYSRNSASVTEYLDFELNNAHENMDVGNIESSVNENINAYGNMDAGNIESSVNENFNAHENVDVENIKAHENGAETDVKQILLSNDDGKKILQHYKRNKIISRTNRKVMVNLIITYLFQNNTKMTVKLAENIADQIVKLFKTELKKIYFLKQCGKAPLGKIYSNYFNHSTRLRNSGNFKKSTRNKDKDKDKHPKIETNGDNCKTRGDNHRNNHLTDLTHAINVIEID